MKPSRIVGVLVLALALTGCATAGGQGLTLAGALGQLSALKRADLEQAKAIAAVAQDPAGWACTDALLKVTDRAPLPAPAGAFSAYMWAREMRRRANAGTDEAVHIACSPLVLDAEKVAVEIGKNFLPGGSLVGKIPIPGLR